MKSFKVKKINFKEGKITIYDTTLKKRNTHVAEDTPCSLSHVYPEGHTLIIYIYTSKHTQNLCIHMIRKTIKQHTPIELIR